MLLRKFLALIIFFLLLPGSLWAGTNTLALFNLRPTNMEAMGVSSDVLFGLIYALENQKSIEVMPRREMEDLLFQKGLVQSDNQQAVIKAGKALGVRHVLFGQVTRGGSRIQTTLKLMDIRSAKVIDTWDHSFPSREAIVPEISVFAEKLAETLTANSNAALPVADTMLPVAPDVEIGNLRASGQGKSILLSWEFDPKQPIIGFHVYRANSEEGPYQFQGKVLKNRYEDGNGRKGLTYFYRVGILSASGQEVKSDLTAKIVHTGEKTPHPPHIMDSEGHVGRISFKFVPSLQNEQDDIKVASYNIYRREKQNPSGDWKKVKTFDNQNRSQFQVAIEFEDKTNLKDGTEYEYAVSSLDKKDRESIYSDIVTVKTIEQPVLKLQQDDLLRMVKLGWSSVDGIKGYRLYRKSEEGDWKKHSALLNGQKTELMDKQGLDDGITYSYYLTAYDQKGETGPSNIVTGKTKALPLAPENLAVENGLVKQVRLSWTPIEDPDVGGYHIYRGESLETLESVTKLRKNSASEYLDKGTVFSPLKDGHRYYYVVATFNTCNAEGVTTVPVTAMTKPRPQSLEKVSAAPAVDRIAVQWEANRESDIRINQLYRSQSGRSWMKIAELESGVTEYEDLDIDPEAKYRYRLIAEDVAGLKSDPADSLEVISPIPKPVK